MRRQELMVVLCLVFGVQEFAHAQQPKPEAFVRSVVAAWKERQDRVKTITCSAKIESFYPKGYLSDFRAEGTIYTQPEPSEDRTFRGGSCSWALDFDALKVRKEIRRTVTYSHLGGKDSEFFEDYGLHLCVGGMYKMFRPRDTVPKRAQETAFTPDVYLYEEGGYIFLFSFTDLPMFWAAGTINGRYPLPLGLRWREDASRFSYRGEAEWKGRKCAVLTIQEQDSTTAIREFWVGLEEPFPVYFCRSRKGEQVKFQLEADYRRQGEFLLPVAWTCTFHAETEKTFRREIYTVDNIEINQSLAAEIFEKRLEPGMLVTHAPKNESYEVTESGDLGPIGAPRASRGGRNWFWLGGALFAAVVLLAALRYQRRRGLEGRRARNRRSTIHKVGG